MADIMGMVYEYQCGETTARGQQCLRQAMHLVEGKRFMCQQHWEQYIKESGPS